jgi:hypothetical protein
MRFYPGDAWRPGRPTVLCLTAAELDNLVYAWLKFTFRVEEPGDELVAQIVASVGTPPLYDDLLEAVAATASRLGGEWPDATVWRVLEQHAELVFRRFLDIPPAQRNDLSHAGSGSGSDSGSAGRDSQRLGRQK